MTVGCCGKKVNCNCPEDPVGGLYSTTPSALASGPVSAAAIGATLESGSYLFALGTGADAGKLIYSGTKAARVRIIAVISMTVDVASSVIAQIIINGVTVGGSTQVSMDSSGLEQVIVVSTVVKLNPGDVIDTNVTTTEDASIFSYQLSAAA